MIMRDEWFGHRDFLTGKEEGDRTEWTLWDFRLIQVFQLIEDFTDKNGFLAWEVDDPKNRVIVATTREVDRVQQALDIAEKKSDNKSYLERVQGSFMSPILKRMNPKDDWPGHKDYFKFLADKYGDE